LIIVLTCIVAIAVIAFILMVRPKDLPAPEPESPFQHLDERKAAIYENLRDLQFEFRVGKLSEQDYQNTKKDLQKELASVLAEVDKIKGQLALNGTAPVRSAQPAPQAPQPAKAVNGRACAHCGASFEKELKFCGECGKPMKVAKA
jgi:NADH pyrophosphatase NudC (nudix superfamily)